MTLACYAFEEVTNVPYICVTLLIIEVVDYTLSFDRGQMTHLTIFCGQLVLAR